MKIEMPGQEEINRAFEEGREAVVTLFSEVEVIVCELAEQLERQAEALKELQARLNKNSGNSGKPPSSDGYGKPPIKRTESLRELGDKPNGGQRGHEGNTLEQVETPDITVIHEAESCMECGTSLKDVEVEGHEERQVFDIPAIRIEVTAHSVEIKICPECGMENRGDFPENLTSSTQYGDGVKTWAAYFTHQHFIPLERTAQVFEDLIGHRISDATVLNATGKLSECVKPATDAIKKQLQSADVINLDESGIRVCGKLHWLHVASNARLTHNEIHACRGKEAIDSANVLPEFTGTAVHDHWKSYFGYKQCDHALCNAHHLRELQYIEKQFEQQWAADMGALLREIKKAVDEIKPNSDNLPSVILEEFERRYDATVNVGYEANSRPPPEPGVPKKKGRKKQSPPLNLLDRLRDFKPQVLRFMYDFRVPFDNNQAERDIRMVKVKQKVSGSFRTVEGAGQFASIRGYISTARKNAVNVFSAIRCAFAGKPFIPSQEIQ